MAAACIGLFAERGNIGALTSPYANATEPSAWRATRVPRCQPSTSPDRTTSASTTSAAPPPAASGRGGSAAGPDVGLCSGARVTQEVLDVGFALTVPPGDLRAAPVRHLLDRLAGVGHGPLVPGQDLQRLGQLRLRPRGDIRDLYVVGQLLH